MRAKNKKHIKNNSLHTKGTATVTVPRDKLERVIEYLSGEEGHYRQEPTRNHIWLAVKALSKALKTTSPKPFTLVRKPSDLLSAQIAAGPCPHCGRIDNWLNDIPLRAFCWGTEERPHAEWRKTVPGPYNPYLPSYNPKARPELPSGITDLSRKKGKNKKSTASNSAE